MSHLRLVWCDCPSFRRQLHRTLQAEADAAGRRLSATLAKYAFAAFHPRHEPRDLKAAWQAVNAARQQLEWLERWGRAA